MNLLIDSSVPEKIVLSIENRAHFFGSANLSENLLLEIKKFFKKYKIEFKNLKTIEIKTDSSFSKTRTVVATANALIYALNLKQKLFKPQYHKDPNITLSKK